MSIRQITGELPRYIGLNALNIVSISTPMDGVGWSCLRVPFKSIDLSDYFNWKEQFHFVDKTSYLEYVVITH